MTSQNCTGISTGDRIFTSKTQSNRGAGASHQPSEGRSIPNSTRSSRWLLLSWLLLLAVANLSMHAPVVILISKTYQNTAAASRQLLDWSFPINSHTAPSSSVQENSQPTVPSSASMLDDNLSAPSLIQYEGSSLSSSSCHNQDGRTDYVSYTDLAELVDGLVQRKLQEVLYVAPGTVQRDYALQSDGAMVDCDLTTRCYSWPLSSFFPSPSLALNDDSRIGQCWSFPSASGQLGIILPTPIIPSQVTIDHIPMEIAANIGQAPRTMILWGLLDGTENMRKWYLSRRTHPTSALLQGRQGPQDVSGHSYAPLAILEYNIHGKWPIQTFTVFDYVQNFQMDFGVIVLEIIDNWGASNTCVYRARLHGYSA